MPAPVVIILMTYQKTKTKTKTPGIIAPIQPKTKESLIIHSHCFLYRLVMVVVIVVTMVVVVVVVSSQFSVMSIRVLYGLGSKDNGIC